MKRSGFKRKTLSEATESPRRRVKGLGGTKPLKKKSRTPEAKLKAELWELCKQIIRKKYGNICYTCGKEGLSGANWHTGHFVSSSVCGGYLRYDLRNLRPQCYMCNISLSGNGAFYYHRILDIHGQEYIDNIFADKARITKLDRTFLEAKISEYKELL